MFKIKFILENDQGFACLKFMQDNEFTKSELLSIDKFKQEPDEMKQNESISYRINSMIQKTMLM